MMMAPLLISTEDDHRGVLVAVRDSGPGIDPSHLEREIDGNPQRTGREREISCCPRNLT
jgi:hypothetical protein